MGQAQKMRMTAFAEIKHLLKSDDALGQRERAGSVSDG
jgi:hypothetical protein